MLGLFVVDKDNKKTKVPYVFHTVSVCTKDGTFSWISEDHSNAPDVPEEVGKHLISTYNRNDTKCRRLFSNQAWVCRCIVEVPLIEDSTYKGDLFVGTCPKCKTVYYAYKASSSLW